MQTAPRKIDINSDAFQNELARTLRFTDKVVEQFGWAYNPDPEINEGIQLGLTRNRLMYGKRYCPCFFVTGDKEEDRICPCKPAIEKEIPSIEKSITSIASTLPSTTIGLRYVIQISSMFLCLKYSACL